MQQHYRQPRGDLGVVQDEMQVESPHPGQAMILTVEPGLDGAPVEAVGPVLDEPADSTRSSSIGRGRSSPRTASLSRPCQNTWLSRSTPQ